MKSEHLTHSPSGHKFQERVKLQSKRSFNCAQHSMAKIPKPKDVVESARKENGVSLSYLAGYRIVDANCKMTHKETLKYYQQLKGCLKKFTKLNNGLVVDIRFDGNNSITYIFVYYLCLEEIVTVKIAKDRQTKQK